MYFKINFVFFICLASIAVGAGVSEELKKPNITIYYQTLCPRSEKFFTHQLYPTASEKSFSDIYEHIEFKPVSILIAEIGSVFNCSHGRKECEGNRVHVCVLNTTEPLEKKMKFLNCTMARASTELEFPTESCAKETAFNISSFNSCVNSTATNATLTENYKEYEKLNAPFPIIILNGMFNESFSNAAVNDFQQTLCGVQEFKNNTKNWCDTKHNSASLATITVLPVFILSIIITKLYE